VNNTTAGSIELNAIHVVKSDAGPIVQLKGPASADRILSDSYQEDTPQMRLMDLAEADHGLHRGFEDQLIYNRQSGLSLFLGALSADRFVTVLHLRNSEGPDPHLVSYDATDTGTTEPLEDQNRPYPPANAVALHLRVAAGESVGSERLMVSIGSDYHAQLETYGRAIRTLHKPRVDMPAPMGWWSWTAYYYHVTEDTMLTNAAWLKQNLASLGYRYFFVDEGYQYTRGEYATADAKEFPRGMAPVCHQIENQGLTFGLWVAPFQVSERSWVYEHHPEWLVRNLAGEPIHIGKVGGRFDQLYALDTTNPGAQEYLRSTYRTLVNDWGVRLIKLDFMDSTAVEGVDDRPNTTAFEALRIGLKIIRGAVGDDVILDKDGSPMLPPVGIVNAGRLSQDTGHTFESTYDAAMGMAARYYMHREFYVSDPDAFTVSTQVIPDRGWHGNKRPLTLDEAEASIAVSAVSGGMFAGSHGPGQECGPAGHGQAEPRLSAPGPDDIPEGRQAAEYLPAEGRPAATDSHCFQLDRGDAQPHYRAGFPGAQGERIVHGDRCAAWRRRGDRKRHARVRSATNLRAHDQADRYIRPGAGSSLQCARAVNGKGRRTGRVSCGRGQRRCAGSWLSLGVWRRRERGRRRRFACLYAAWAIHGES
jgi:hypothetical protein